MWLGVEFCLEAKKDSISFAFRIPLQSRYLPANMDPDYPYANYTIHTPLILIGKLTSTSTSSICINHCAKVTSISHLYDKTYLGAHGTAYSNNRHGSSVSYYLLTNTISKQSQMAHENVLHVSVPVGVKSHTYMVDIVTSLILISTSLLLTFLFIRKKHI